MGNSTSLLKDRPLHPIQSQLYGFFPAEYQHISVSVCNIKKSFFLMIFKPKTLSVQLRNIY